MQVTSEVHIGLMMTECSAINLELEIFWNGFANQSLPKKNVSLVYTAGEYPKGPHKCQAMK